MGVINVQGPTTGRSYAVKIAGETPTPQEQARIDQYVNQQDVAYDQYLQSRYGAPQEEPLSIEEPDQEIDKTAFRRGFERQGFGFGPQFQASLGNTLETLGSEYGWDGIQDYGERLRDKGRDELARLEAEDASVRFGDIEGVGTGLSFAGEVIGEESGDLAIQTGATLAGGIFGPLGMAVGRAAGVGYTTIKALPEFFSEAVETQKRAGEDVSIRKAAAATAGAALAEAIADYFVVGKLLNPSEGKRIARALKDGAKSAGVEGATEVSQQVIMRAQAGLPLDNAEAFAEYAEALAGGMVAGGTFGAGLSAISAAPTNLAERQLDEDYNEMALTNAGRLKFSEDAERENIQQNLMDLEEQQNARETAQGARQGDLALPAPEQPIAALPSPDTVSPMEFDQKSYDKSVFDRVLQQIKADKKVNVTRIMAKVKQDIPELKRTQVNDVINDLKARGILADNPSSKGGKHILMGSIAPEINDPDVQLRRTIDSSTANIKTLQDRLNKLMNYELPTVQRTGFDLQGRKATEDSTLAEISAVEQEINANKDMIETAQNRLPQTHVPRFEKVGLPDNLKQVPLDQLDENAGPLVERYENQKALLEEYKQQAAGIKKALNKLNNKSKKRNLSSVEVDRFTRLQEKHNQLSARAAEVQSNLKTPKQIIEDARAEQAQQARDIKELETRVKAAEAKAVDRDVQESLNARQAADSSLDEPRVPIFTSIFNNKQASVFSALRQRLNKYNLKDIKLEGEQQIQGAEGSYSPTARLISLSMGMYDPNMTEQEYNDAVSEVMDHEVIHALKDIGVITDKEMKILEKAAGKTQYVKRLNNGETQQRKYTYLDRAKKMYPELDDSAQREEAIAEMFRDYSAGRLKIGGAPRSLFTKIKDFFRGLAYSMSGEGFNSVDDIFQGIQSGEVGARDRATSEADQVRQSRLAATEEEMRPEREIMMPIDPNLPRDQIRRQIQNLTKENVSLVKGLIKRIDSTFGTKSGDNVKDLSKVTQKAQRPSILAAKPWHTVAHIRDTYRFKTVIDDFRDVPNIFNELLKEGVGLVKIDTNKLFAPKEWGWRIIAFDLRMPNGQLVEWYLPLRELEVEKKARGHLIFEEWRNKSQEEMNAQQVEFMKAVDTSWTNYDNAFQAALGRMGIDRQEAEASWRSAETSMSEAALNARRSSGIMVSSSGSLGTQVPSSERKMGSEPSVKSTARMVPSSISAREAIVSTSDDYNTGTPTDTQVKFSRLPRTENVQGLQSFIRNNPDGFTLDASTFEPASGGFVVAPLKEAEIIVGQDLPEEVILGYIEDNKDISREIGKPVYLGGWFDSESEQYFLDNTLIVPTAEEALYIAEAADQLAIFDLNNFEEIRTNDGIEQLKQGGAYRSDTAIGYQRNLAEIGRRFTEARNQRSSRQREQLARPSKQSRLVLPLTDEQRAASILDYVDPKTGKPLFRNKAGSETLVSFANKLLELRGTKSYDIINSEQDREDVANIMAAEAEAALLSSSDALGWYDATLKLAKRALIGLYPEVSPTKVDGTANPAFDPQAEIAFDYATAVTSNGLSVIDNYKFAAKQYDEFKVTGKFPLKGTGDQGGSMIKAFEFWNALVDQGLTVNEIGDLLMQQRRRGDLNLLLMDVFGVNRVKDLPIQVDGKEEADTVVSVAYVIGPKIGNGFFQNLRGNFEPLTMDRWWMRFVNRVTGNPKVVYSDELVGKNVDRVWNRVSNPEAMEQIELDMLADAREALGITTLERSDTEVLARELEKQWNKRYNRAYNDKLKELLEEMDFTIVRGSVRGPDAEGAKAIARDARPAKPELALASGALVQKIKPALQEDPRGGPDRTAMRSVANRARELLVDGLGVDLTNADFQALMWYAEKRIFEAGGVRKGQGDDNDYADGAIALLRERGIPDDKIKAALPESERGRVNRGNAELERNSAVGAKARDAVQEPIEGNFFAPRELSLVNEEQALQSGLTPQELAETNEVIAGVAVDEAPVKLSRVPVADAYMPVAAPVKMKDGSLNPVYGYIRLGGKLRPVVLPKGSHTVFENGIEAGGGLLHIHERSHDKELVENSKYKRVENAIYDIMRRWQDQGYQDGDAVIGYDSREGYVLDWRDNLAFSAPPLRLVLEYGENADGAPIKSAFYVKTFFPLLEKKRRAVPQKSGRNVMRQAKADVPKMLSKLVLSTSPMQNTPNFSSADLEQTMQNLRYAGTQNTIASILGKAGKPFGIDKERIDRGTEWLFTKMQDDFLPVAKMYDKLRQSGANISRDMDAYFQELLMHGVNGAKKTTFQTEELEPLLNTVSSIELNRVEEAEITRLSGYYKEMKDKTKNSGHALANAYLYALHAIERNARISSLSNGNDTTGSGMSNTEANAIINYVNNMDAGKSAALRKIASDTRDIIDGTNSVYIDGGLIPDYRDDDDIDDDTRQAYTKYDNYVPLRGFADSEMELDRATSQQSFTGGSGQRFGGVGSPNKKALGRKSYAGDIIANIAVQRQAAIDKAERNKVGIAFLNLLESDDAVIQNGMQDIATVLERHPLRRVMRNGRISVMPDRDFHNPDLPILAVRRGGVEHLIGFYDDRMANAFKGGSVKQVNAFMGAMHALVRTYANMLTSWNPAFLLGNLPRDIETALYNSQQYNMKGSSKDIMKGIPSAYRAIYNISTKGDKGDPYWRNRYQQFYDNGGQNVLNQMGDLLDNQKDIQKTISSIVEADGRGNKAGVRRLMSGTGKGVKSIANYVEAVNTAVENSTRLAFFDAAVRNLEAQGVPTERALREAAAGARQLTTNFAKGGQNKNFWNTFYLFFNASLQGSMAMLNATVNSKKARVALAGIVATGFLMDQLNSILSGDEDEDGYLDYDNMNEYKLAHSFVIPTGDGEFVTIPLAYGLNIFYNFGRSTSAMLRGKYTVGEAVGSSLGTLVSTMNPFGGNSPWTFVAPTVLDPAVELLTNKNFMDGPIYKELSPFEQYKSRSALHWSTTSPTAISIAKFVNDTIGGGTDVIPGEVLGMRVDMNPDAIEHMMDFLLGGAGKFGVQLFEFGANGVPAIIEGEWENDMVRRTPLLNKVYTAVTEKDRSGDYYEKRDEILAIDAELRDARASGDRDRVNAVLSRYPDQVRLIGPVKKIASAIRKLNKRKRLVMKAANISDDRRRELLDAIETRKQKLIAASNVLMQDL